MIKLAPLNTLDTETDHPVPHTIACDRAIAIASANRNKKAATRSDDEMIACVTKRKTGDL
jgi:hypothetical protein